MILEKSNLEEFVQKIKDKKLFCFGASKMAEEIHEEYPELELENYIVSFIDNAKEKVHTMFQFGSRKVEIISVEEFLQKIEADTTLLITSRFYVDIFEQLQNYSMLKYTSCYIWPMLAPQYKSDPYLKEKIKKYHSEESIPKIIHYIWFGKSKIPKLEERCIQSWCTLCPDYEVVRWDESNYDITKNVYMKEAYDAGKWSFASDYARLDILYQYGGIYLDTDVEILKSLDDLLSLKGFIGFESKKLVAMGLGIGAIKNHSMIQEMRDDYAHIHFRNKDGSYNLTPCPFIQTKLLEKKGLILNNKLQYIEDMLVLPQECLNPDNNMCVHITENSYTRHHFSGSWTDKENRELIRKMMQFAN